MAITDSQVLEALKELTDPNTRKDYVTTKSARNVKVEGDRVSIDVLLEEAHGPSPAAPEPDAIHDQRSPCSGGGALPALSPRTLVQALTEVTIVVASPAAMRTSLPVVVDAS